MSHPITRANLYGSGIFTTGQIAKMLCVAPRTVSKWFDNGRLEGYRIPGSLDRRITREALVRFIVDHNLPMPEELRDKIDRAYSAYVFSQGIAGTKTVHPFTLGVECSAGRVARVIIGALNGVDEGLRLARAVKEFAGKTVGVAFILPPDRSNLDAEGADGADGADRVFPSDVSVLTLWEWVTGPLANGVHRDSRKVEVNSDAGRNGDPQGVLPSGLRDCDPS